MGQEGLSESRGRDEMVSEPSQEKTNAGARLARARRILAYVLAILFGPLILLLSWSVISRLQTLPRLTPAAFDAAQERWAGNGPRDYNVEVVVEGRQPATYRTEVRGGEVQSAYRNGQPLTQARTMGTWTVPGMFATMETDVRRIEQAAAEGTATSLILRAQFDPRYGYPARYHRTETVRYGANPAVSWRVTLFDDLTGGEGVPSSAGDSPGRSISVGVE